MNKISTSIIIPTYNRPKELRACLGALSQMKSGQGSDHLEYEVIVVDDGGSLDLDKIIDEFNSKIKVKLFKQHNSGPASARNTGAKHAEGEYLLFTDDDCCPSETWALEMVKVLRGDPETLVGGQTLNGLGDNIFSEASQEIIHFLYSYYNHDPKQALFFASNNMGISKKLFLRIGGFDVTTLKATAEDREICDRLVFQGHKLTYCPQATIYHYHWLTLKGLVRQHFNYGKGAYYFRKVRSLRGQESLKVEPSHFYWQLIISPFKRKRSRKLFLCLLLILIQATNALGFFYEYFVRTLQGDSIEAKT